VPQAIKHQQGMPSDRPSHAVKLDDTSSLFSLARGTRALVNSHHHQAVEKVGGDLVATAWSSDGLIEAVEDRRAQRFVVGVQWHPELGWQEDRLSQALFNRFVSVAKEYASTETAGVATTEEEITNLVWKKEKSASESR
jgi:putative glutamine amidotransferase